MDEGGFLENRRYLLHDRDSRFCRSFRRILESGPVTMPPLPVRSPNLNAYAERWVRSVKDECLSKLILFGEASLRRALREYLVPTAHTRSRHRGRRGITVGARPPRMPMV